MTAPDDVSGWELLDCPLCGCTDHETSPWPTDWNRDWWKCNCGNPDCGMEVGAPTPEEAVAKWNRRAAHADLAGDPRSESGNAEEVAQWLYANGFREAAATIRTQLDVRNRCIADLSGEVRELVEKARALHEQACDGEEHGGDAFDESCPLCNAGKELEAALAKFHPTHQEKP